MKRLPADLPYYVTATSLAFLFAAFTAFLDIKLALVEVCVIIIFLIVAVIRYRKSVSDRMSVMKELASRLDPEQASALKVFPLPVIMCDSAGRILWINELFKSRVMNGDELQTDSIEQFISGKHLDEVRGTESFSAEYGGRCYTVYLSGSSSGEANYVLYFFDDTALKATAEAYKYSKPAVIRISVDNVEEVAKSLKESDKASLLGGVEKLIEDWMSEFEGVLIGTDTGKFTVVTQERTALKMIESRFSVLKSVREYSYQGRTGVSLSIGMGRGETLSQCDNFSVLALDMALGRGGDQAAVNTSGKYEFYGGVSSGMEKSSRVKNRIIATALWELFEGSDNIIIMGHRFTDLDALGAAIGLRKAAESLGKQAFIAMQKDKTLAHPLLERMADEYENDVIISQEKALELLTKKSLLVIVDTHRADFVDFPEVYKRATSVVVMDHHRKNVDFISDAILFYHDPNASSASEMVTEMLLYMNGTNRHLIGKFEAEALMAGIMLDTKSFVMRTGVQTFEAAAYLRDRGADTVAVKQLFSNSLEAYRQKNGIVDSADIYRECAISVAETENGEMRIVAAQAADELLNISGVRASFVLFKDSGMVNISARSMGSVNVQIIMEELGGGGHQTMAAAQLKEATPDDARVRLLQAIDKFYAQL